MILVSIMLALLIEMMARGMKIRQTVLIFKMDVLCTFVTLYTVCKMSRYIVRTHTCLQKPSTEFGFDSKKQQREACPVQVIVCH